MVCIIVFVNSFDMVVVNPPPKKKINILAQDSCNFFELKLQDKKLYEPVFKKK